MKTYDLDTKEGLCELATDAVALMRKHPERCMRASIAERRWITRGVFRERVTCHCFLGWCGVLLYGEGNVPMHTVEQEENPELYAREQDQIDEFYNKVCDPFHHHAVFGTKWAFEPNDNSITVDDAIAKYEKLLRENCHGP